MRSAQYKHTYEAHNIRFDSNQKHAQHHYIRSSIIVVHGILPLVVGCYFRLTMAKQLRCMQLIFIYHASFDILFTLQKSPNLQYLLLIFCLRKNVRCSQCCFNGFEENDCQKLSSWFVKTGMERTKCKCTVISGCSVVMYSCSLLIENKQYSWIAFDFYPLPLQRWQWSVFFKKNINKVSKQVRQNGYNSITRQLRSRALLRHTTRYLCAHICPHSKT